jgi:threonine/homoserine/homoserine lactone efflux protein
MISFHAVLVFAAALFVYSALPGPGISAIVSQVVANGWKSVLPLLLSIWIGEVMWLGVTLAGLAYAAAKYETIFIFIKYCGVAYLLYLAYKMWNAPSELSATGHSQTKSWPLFGTGLALTLGNPKSVVFYTAVLPSIVDLKTIGIAGALQLVSVLVIENAAIDLSWTGFSTGARKILRRPHFVKWTKRTAAVAMAGAAVTIAVK